MRNSRRVETRHDRTALAKDAGLGRVSALGVAAGALTGLAALEVLVGVAGAIGVGINRGTNFANWSNGQFKTVLGAILVLSAVLAFVAGGYVSGRMARRRGATHGLLGGTLGAVLAAVAVAAVVGSGADNALARVARHLQVADTWHEWRSFGLVGVIVAIPAMVVGGFVGGIKGERWHGVLLARAVDPAYGPEAEERVEARKRITEAEVARLAAADHVGRLRGAARSSRPDALLPATEPDAAATMAAPTPGLRRSAVLAAAGRDRPAADEPTNVAVDAEGRHRHLLGRR